MLGTDNVDAQLGDGLPAEVVLGLPRAVISDLDRARGIVLLGPDLKEELPVLHLRVRRAAVDLDVPVVEIAPRATGLTREASAVLRHAPGEVAPRSQRAGPWRSRATAPRRVTVRSSARSPRSTVARATSSWCSAGSRSPSRPTPSSRPRPRSPSFPT